MYNALIIGGFLIVLALMLVHWKDAGLPGIEQFADAVKKEEQEGFASVAVDPARVPACTERSVPAQALLARFATVPVGDEAASELRLLLSKLCCIEADIKTPAAGKYRTAPLQFRTSHDMEPASTLVGRCLAGAVQKRDVELIMEKFEKRGAELVKRVLGGDCGDAQAEFMAVANLTRAALASCCRPAPTMDHPLGARDLGFWEPERVANLSQYQGISSAPK
jgi:hypothetical protein